MIMIYFIVKKIDLWYIIYDKGSFSTIKDSLIVRQEGNRTVERNIKFYNLNLIIAVGYRVKSVCGTQFRIWANKLIRKYLIIWSIWNGSLYLRWTNC